MTKQETLMILGVLKAAYPGFYATIKPAEAEGIVGLWQEMFFEPAQVVAAAVKALIATRTSTYPPTIGEVKDKIRLITTPADTGAAEAWSLVRDAISDGIYGAEKGFAALPPDIQSIVGSHAQLTQWAQMDAETVQSVVASNFMKAYREHQARKKQVEVLPPDIRERLEDNNGKAKRLTQAH